MNNNTYKQRLLLLLHVTQENHTRTTGVQAVHRKIATKITIVLYYSMCSIYAPFSWKRNRQ